MLSRSDTTKSAFCVGAQLASLTPLLFALSQPFHTHQSKIYLHTTVPFCSGHFSATCCCKAKQLNPPSGSCLHSPALRHQGEAYFVSQLHVLVCGPVEPTLLGFPNMNKSRFHLQKFLAKARSCERMKWSGLVILFCFL